jgi:hypothetical protein
MMAAMRLILLLLPINLWAQWALLTQTEEVRILFKKGHDIDRVGDKPKGSY